METEAWRAGDCDGAGAAAASRTTANAAASTAARASRCCASDCGTRAAAPIKPAVLAYWAQHLTSKTQNQPHESDSRSSDFI